MSIFPQRVLVTSNVLPETEDKTVVSSEVTSFLVGASPAILDVNAALGEDGRAFEIINDGPGNFTVAISNDGTSFGSEATVKQQEVYAVENITLSKVRITHVTDSAYRIRAL